MCVAPKSNEAEQMPGTMAHGSIAVRRSTPDDAELLFTWRAEPTAARFQPLRLMSVEELRHRLHERAETVLDPTFTGDALWIIERSGTAVGWISLRVTDRDQGTGAIGYTIGESVRRQGYATAAVRLIVALAFDRAGADLARLEAVAAVDNRDSRRVLERAGFSREGRARGLLIIAGRRVDHYRYELLRDDTMPAGDDPHDEKGTA